MEIVPVEMVLNIGEMSLGDLAGTLLIMVLLPYLVMYDTSVAGSFIEANCLFAFSSSRWDFRLSGALRDGLLHVSAETKQSISDR